MMPIKITYDMSKRATATEEPGPLDPFVPSLTRLIYYLRQQELTSHAVVMLERQTHLFRDFV